MSEEKIRILYVDDDTGNLNVFKAAFRRDYELFLVTSVDEGLKVLSENEIHIVFADQRMPKMTGVQFFEKIVHLYPDPIRILVTGYSDMEAVVNAINKGQVYRYITKPWRDHELKIDIENAFQMYDVRKRLETTNKELRKTNEELNRFIYSTSHELKAPLTTIAGVLRMAESNSLGIEQSFTMIDKCVKNLELFIRSLLDYYRNQKYEEYLREINFDKLIKDMIESYMFFESIADINFNISVEQKETFVNDELRMRVILNNLLSNCIKYQKKDSAQKSIYIKIVSTSSTASIEFEDNGIGINKDYLDNIFKMFYRATDLGSGSGLGLYIVKEAIEKISGSIHVESTEGVGTKFMLSIPNRVNELVRESE